MITMQVWGRVEALLQSGFQLGAGCQAGIDHSLRVDCRWRAVRVEARGTVAYVQSETRVLGTAVWSSAGS